MDNRRVLSSRLRKKSPVWRNGYHTGCRDTLREKVHTIKTSDDVDDNNTWAAYVERMSDQHPEEYLAGDLDGYQRGYNDGYDSKKSGVSGIVVGVVVGMAAVGGFFIGFAL